MQMIIEKNKEEDTLAAISRKKMEELLFKLFRKAVPKDRHPQEKNYWRFHPSEKKSGKRKRS